MTPRPVRILSHCLTLALALGVPGCGGEDPASAPGVARLVVRTAGDASSIARVTIRASAGDGAAFSALAVDLTQSGGQWIGRIPGIPAGGGRRFDASGRDTSGAERMTGSARADVQAGAVTVVAITMSAVSSRVTIDAVSWSPASVRPLGVVRMAVAAHGEDASDTVSYGWSADCGTAGTGAFDAAAAAETRWTAPGVAGVCHFSLRVGTSRGAADELDFTIPVVNVGDTDIHVSEDTYPVLSAVDAVVRLGSTMEVDLAVEAADPDGDALTYRWSSDGPDGCPGIVFDLDSPYAPAAAHASLPPPAATCRIEVTVSDGRPEGTVAAIWLPPGTYGP